MNETLHANIFFFITSVATIAVTIALLIVLYYVVSILREVQKIVIQVRKASDSLEQDIAYLKSEVRSSWSSIFGALGSLLSFATSSFVRPTKRKGTRKNEENATNSEEVVY